MKIIFMGTPDFAVGIAYLQNLRIHHSVRSSVHINHNDPFENPHRARGRLRGVRRMKIIFMGTPDFAVGTLQALLGKPPDPRPPLRTWYHTCPR